MEKEKIEEQSYLSVNGKTFTAKKWLGLFIIFATAISMLGNLFGYVIEPALWKQEVRNEIQLNRKEIDVNCKRIDNLEKNVKINQLMNSETNTNLQRLMIDKFKMDYIHNQELQFYKNTR